MTGTADRSWQIRRTSRPLPAKYIAAVLLATATTGVLPHLEELRRCLRQAGAKDSGSDAGVAGPKERFDTAAAGGPPLGPDEEIGMKHATGTAQAAVNRESDPPA